MLARHHRQRGDDVFFLTGTDEHGEPVAEEAERQGVEPQELADRNAQRFEALWPRLGVSNDFFVRTSDPRHGEKVKEVLTRVKENGHVYEGTYDGWYCPRCADFKTDAEIGPGNTCLIHKVPLTREHEDNWFFRLSAFQEPLERLYEERPDFVMPPHRFNEARSFIASGLQDVSLTRAKLRWGVPVPWDPGQVFYVWWDALLNYYTALSFGADQDVTEKFWPAHFHVIGKDILRFHTIFWPALLMAAELELPRHVFVHGYLLSPSVDDADAGDADEGAGELEKMSKSRGNVIDPFRVADVFGPDALRHYCFREVTFGQDGPVSESGFAVRYETELANEYGNLANRTLAMIRRYRDGVVPDTAPEDVLAQDFAGLDGRVAELLDRADLSAALDEIWQRVRRLNRYVEERAPWVLARDEAQAEELDRVLAGLAEGLRVVAVLLFPYMPATTEKLLAALGQRKLSASGAAFGAEGGGARVGDLEALFPKDPAPVP